jgi:hypothetical protein
LDLITEQAKGLPEEQMKHITERIKLIRRWERTGRHVLPFVLKMLGGA